MYNFKEVEKKWQDKWFNEKSFKAIDFHPTKPKYYVLYEFYNISGNLHMGHLKGTVPADALARMKRLQGYNVLFPIGGDSFGLPAENAAIKTGINPKEFVKNQAVPPAATDQALYHHQNMRGQAVALRNRYASRRLRRPIS